MTIKEIHECKIGSRIWVRNSSRSGIPYIPGVITDIGFTKVQVTFTGHKGKSITSWKPVNMLKKYEEII